MINFKCGYFEPFIFTPVIATMKSIFQILLLILPYSLSAQGQNFSFFLCDSQRQPITQASLTVNEKVAMETENGYYVVNDISFTGNPYTKMKVTAVHPQFTPLDDSLFVTQQIMLAKSTETAFFLSSGQRIPCAYYPNVSVKYIGDQKSSEELYKSLEKTNGRVIQERDACGSWKGERSSQGTYVTIAHDRLDDAIDFRKKTGASSAITLGATNAFVGLRNEVYIMQEQYKPLNPKLTEIVMQWKKEGYIESAYPNPGMTVGYQIIFSPEYSHEAFNFLNVLSKEVPSVFISQELLSVACLD